MIHSGQLPLILGICSLLSSMYCFASPLEILVENAAEPFSRADGTGYANELVIAAFAAAGIEAKLKVVPYSRCKNMVLEARAIACFNMAWENSMAGKVKFPHPTLFTVIPMYFQNKALPLKAKKESELNNGIKVGVVSGYEYPPSASKLSKQGVVFVPGHSEQINLKQLANGSLNAALVMANEIQTPHYWAENAGVASQVEVAFPSSRQNVYIGFSVNHPQGLWALKKFEIGYKTIEGNEKLKQIKAKWLPLK